MTSHDPNPWHKYPEEKPGKHDDYLVITKKDTMMEVAEYSGDWWLYNGKIAILYWRERPPFPKDLQ